MTPTVPNASHASSLRSSAWATLTSSAAAANATTKGLFILRGGGVAAAAALMVAGSADGGARASADGGTPVFAVPLPAGALLPPPRQTAVVQPRRDDSDYSDGGDKCVSKSIFARARTRVLS